MSRVLSADWVLPIEAPPIEDGAVEIEGSRIVAVGTASELGEGERFDGAAILPGFVNAHSHLEYAVYVGFGDGLSFAPWLDLHVARKSRIGWDDFVAISRLGAAQCLASGVTTLADASFSGAAAVACAELGLAGVVHLEVFGADPVPALRRFHEKLARVEDCFSERLRPGVSPHTPYTCSTEVYASCAELGLPIATHFNESASEVQWLTSGEGPMRPFADLLVPPDGRTGIRRLVAAGLLGPDVLAAHCVKVDEEEIDLLAEHGVSVAHCPRSNAQLGCGVAPVAELLEAGVDVGVGTDSPASTPSFDVFEELRAVVAGARLRAERAEAFSAAAALELATLGSARALGLEDEIGSLAPGKRADLTVLSLEETALLPWEDPAAAVVLGGAPDRVVLTVVDGETRYEKGGLEWHELLRDATSARSRMLGRGRPVAKPA